MAVFAGDLIRHLIDPFFPYSSFSKEGCQTLVEVNSYVNCKQSLFFSKIGREKQGKEGLKTT